MKKIIAIGIAILLSVSVCYGAGSITIASPDPSIVKNTFIDATSAYQYRNLGANVLTYVGIYSGNAVRDLTNFTTLVDSINKVVVDSGAINIDSAIVTKTIAGATYVGAGETLFVAFFPLIRYWGEGTTVNGVGTGCSNINADSISGSAAVLWGTPGALNTSSDRSATKETISSRTMDTKIVPSQTGTITIPISGPTVTNMFNGTVYGVILDTVRTVGDVTKYVSLHSDDAATPTNRPKITIYYTVIPGSSTPMIPRRRIDEMMGRIDEKYLICLYEEEFQR